MEPWASREEIEQQLAYYRALDALVRWRLRAPPHETVDIDQQLKELWGSDLLHLTRDHPRQMIAHYEDMLSGGTREYGER